MTTPPSSAPLPMIGAVIATVIDVTTVSIHGDAYYDTLIQTAAQQGTNQGHKLRVPHHACADLPDNRPQPGQRLAFQLLMGQVMSVALAR